MSDLVLYQQGIPELTKAEAEELDSQLSAKTAEWAFGLFVMALQKGYKRLGFASMEAYCEVRWDMSDRTANNWIVRVLVALEGNGFTAINCIGRGNGFPFSGSLLSVAVSRRIHSLPADRRQEAWKMLHLTGAVNLPVTNQLEEMTRWERREGLIEPPKRRILPDEIDVEYCKVCGENWTLPHEDMCAMCQKENDKKANQPEQESVTSDPIRDQVPAPVPAYLRTRAPEGLRDGPRPAVSAVMVLPTDDPCVLYARCEVPVGGLTAGSLFTVAIHRDQLR